MPPAKHSQTPRTKDPSPSRHRSKPKFDIPVEAAAPEPSVGWVYRAEAEATPAPAIAAPATQTLYPREAPAAPPEKSSPNPFLMIGEGLYLVGLGSVTLMYRATSELIGMPMRLAGMLTSD